MLQEWLWACRETMGLQRLSAKMICCAAVSMLGMDVVSALLGKQHGCGCTPVRPIVSATDLVGVDFRIEFDSSCSQGKIAKSGIAMPQRAPGLRQETHWNRSGRLCQAPGGSTAQQAAYPSA